MLLDPKFIIANWQLVATAIVLIIIIKFGVVSGIVRLFGYSTSIALLAGAGLLQIGEFSFILAKAGVDSGIISSQSYSLIIASAIITMLMTPLSVSLVSRFQARLVFKSSDREIQAILEASPLIAEDVGIDKPIIIAGFGRIGQNIAQSLRDIGLAFGVIEINPELTSKLKCDGVTCIYGDASNAHCFWQVH
jgi:CPA2 family monovalent cation:H+ antiporter-2